jgi:hypothetical protein
MKIYTSNYRHHWISPYTVLERALFWKDWENISYDTPWVERWSNRLEPVCVAVQKFLDFVHPQIRVVKIDHYDTWNMDSTLAQIILPMLKQLNATKQGAPLVEDADVPEHLRSTAAPAKANEYDTDDNHFARWEWVMEELIWTFTQLHPDSDWESQYHTGEIDIVWGKPDTKGSVKMLRGPKDTHKFDVDGYQRHQARITNGLRLFGTYYRGLWD